MFTKTTSIIALSTALLAPSVCIADTAKTEACAINTFLANDNAKGAINYLDELFSWNPKIQKTIVNSLKALESFHYDASNAYVIADFGDISKETFIVSNMADQGAMYIRLRYEQVQGKLRIINIYFKNNYPDVMAKGAFAQPPAKIDC
jgi:hypothetical protein